MRKLLIAIVALLVVAVPLYAHTALLSSSPAKNATVGRGAVAVRLVFSEPIEASLSTIAIVDAAGHRARLVTRSDPHDVHAVIADDTITAAGTYSVEWHVVSADGHPVGGSYKFFVAGNAGSPSGSPADSQASASATPAPTQPSISASTSADSAPRTSSTPSADEARAAALPLRLALLRAAASFATLATAGLLAFLAWLLPGVGEGKRRARVRPAWLAVSALLLSSAHALAWAGYATNYAGMHAAQAALMSSAGRAECARVVFCVLTLWSLLLVRSTPFAAFFATCAMLATAAIGHAAAINPGLLIPIKALHVASVALWLGGLIILAKGAEIDDLNAANYARSALRVSVVALTAVVVIALTGLAQTLLVIRPAELFTTAYGLLSLAKVGVLFILIGFGVANKLRNVPAVQRGEAIHVLKRAVTWEIAVIAVAFVLAGALAYTAPPEHNAQQTGSVQ